MSASEIAVRAVIHSALPDLVIDAEASALYELHPDTAAEQAVTWRKTIAENDWVEGSFPTSAVRENVTENLSIWAYGSNADEAEHNAWEVTRRLSLLKFTIELTMVGVTQLWTCFASEYRVSTRHEFRHQAMSLITASVPRLPRKVVTSATYGSVDA